MTFEELYNKTITNQIVGWTRETTPTEDIEKLSETLSIQYNKDMKEFMKTNPLHPVTIFHAGRIFEDDLDKKHTQACNTLWKKYLEMRKTKLPADDEYYDLLDNVIKITKEKLEVKNLNSNDLMFFNDDRLGDSDFVHSVVERMAEISKNFLQVKPKNTTSTIQQKSLEDILNYINHYDDVGYLMSDKNGSFMTAIDKNTSRIHISENKKDLFDTDSSVKHEMGHALYQNRILSKNTEIGKIGHCISLSLHESSSIIHEISLAGIDYNVRDRVVNLYRLGTDKVHYIIHIYIRMKLEKMLFDGDITVRQLPEKWDDLVEEYIGIRPNNQWEGFLQDVHWNSGSFGYFHSYAIGFFNAVTMYQEIKDEFTDDEHYNTKIILKKINKWYGHYNEYSFDILKDMHPNIEESLHNYENFIMGKYTFNG